MLNFRVIKLLIRDDLLGRPIHATFGVIHLRWPNVTKPLFGSVTARQRQGLIWTIKIQIVVIN